MEYLSVHYVSSEVWSVMRQVTKTTTEIALFLLPTFISIDFCVRYIKDGLNEVSSKAAIIENIAKGMVLALLLCHFEEINQVLDHITSALIDELGLNQAMQKYLEAQKANLETNQADGFWGSGNYIIQSILNKIKNLVLGFLQMFSRGVMHAIRGYLLVFSTQIGPLAIAMSALPGRYQKIAANWFSLHLSFFMWGFTMALIDLSIIQLNIKTVAGCDMLNLIGSVALVAMYLIVGTITGLYIGEMMGGMIFTTVTSFAIHQIVATGKQIYKLKKESFNKNG
ncbi:hypothetical protein [Cardinium endosymbiont of Nabis limbatus]|uniref:hypothetical protein n=1 Tax=Cardinium endosymbiont of Nabis limbatus TaxID=3066217 RepID=UPI003AF3A266